MGLQALHQAPTSSPTAIRNSYSRNASTKATTLFRAGEKDRCRADLMPALGHVWTAPWQELSDVAAALVGCGHVSGLLMRQVWPLALMPCADRVPIENTHFKVR